MGAEALRGGVERRLGLRAASEPAAEEVTDHWISDQMLITDHWMLITDQRPRRTAADAGGEHRAQPVPRDPPTPGAGAAARAAADAAAVLRSTLGGRGWQGWGVGRGPGGGLRTHRHGASGALVPEDGGDDAARAEEADQVQQPRIVAVLAAGGGRRRPAAAAGARGAGRGGGGWDSPRGRGKEIGNERVGAGVGGEGGLVLGVLGRKR